MSKSTFGYIAIVALLLVTCFFSLNLFLKERTDHDLLDIRSFPYTIGDWKGQDLAITEKEYDILETRNLISRKYVNSAQQKIYLFIIYSETNRAVFHPPEVCIVGDGITINDKKTEKINTGKSTFLANKLYLEKNNYNSLALYCYKAGDFYTDNFYFQQVRFALNQILGKGRRGGATIRVSAQVRGDEKATLGILKRFMEHAVETLEELS